MANGSSDNVDSEALLLSLVIPCSWLGCNLRIAELLCSVGPSSSLETTTEKEKCTLNMSQPSHTKSE